MTILVKNDKNDTKITKNVDFLVFDEIFKFFVIFGF